MHFRAFGTGMPNGNVTVNKPACFDDNHFYRLRPIPSFKDKRVSSGFLSEVPGQELKSKV